MSIMSVEIDGKPVDAKEFADPIRDEIKRAREHRRRFELGWQSNMAFASGQQWLVGDPKTRTLRAIQQMDPSYKGRELYTADQITKYRTQALGELGSDDDRPSLLLQRDDKASEDFQKAVNKALGYGWDYEWDGDDTLAQVDRYVIDLGTAAVRCRFDASIGGVAQQGVPHQNGQPLFGDQAIQAVSAQMLGGGEPVSYQDIRAGKICWDPLSAFGILPPPGVPHERDFPYDCIVSPTRLEMVKAEYGQAAAELKEDKDIASQLGQQTTGASDPAIYGISDGAQSTLKGQVWLFLWFRRPTPKYPKGQVVHFAGNDFRLLRVDNKLPYVAPDESYRSGIAYFHWWRMTGRFWSRSLVEALKDGQRSHNKRRTQSNEIIDRSMPAIFVDEASKKAARREGLINELIVIPQGARDPRPYQGHGPGPWMSEDIQQIRQDLTDAATIQAPTLGENPANVTTYGQLALLREADQVKRSDIMRERKAAIRKLVEDSVYDMRTYWGPEKQIALAGDEDRVEAEVFNANAIPPFFIVKVAKGAAKPRSEAAEIQKVQDIYTAALNSTAVAMRPMEWVKWYKDSLEAGQALDLPPDPGNSQLDKAELENHLLLAGQDVTVAYYDDANVHIPIHREAQVEAELSGDVRAVQTIEYHVQAHLNMARANAELQQQQMQQQLVEGYQAVTQGQPAENGAQAQPQSQSAPPTQGAPK